MARCPLVDHQTMVQSGWAPCVPFADRYESVTVLPYHPSQRAVRIVEIFGDRREVLFEEAPAA